MRHVSAVLLALVGSAASAEQWFMIQAPVSQSVDTSSIRILPNGFRQARVKLDMSLVPLERNEPANAPMVLITDSVFDCKKHVSRIESTEAHLADGTVRTIKSKNHNAWLRAEPDMALAYVCAWPGTNLQEGENQ